MTHRQARNPEVASEKRRFFGGACPIHETGRQSRYNIFLLRGNLPVSWPRGKRVCAQDAARFTLRGRMRRKLTTYTMPEDQSDPGFYLRGVGKHPAMCTIFSMALSCRLQH